MYISINNLNFANINNSVVFSLNENDYMSIISNKLIQCNKNMPINITKITKDDSNEMILQKLGGLFWKLFINKYDNNENNILLINFEISNAYNLCEMLSLFKNREIPLQIYLFQDYNELLNKSVFNTELCNLFRYIIMFENNDNQESMNIIHSFITKNTSIKFDLFKKLFNSCASQDSCLIFDKNHELDQDLNKKFYWN